MILILNFVVALTIYILSSFNLPHILSLSPSPSLYLSLYLSTIYINYSLSFSLHMTFNGEVVAAYEVYMYVYVKSTTQGGVEYTAGERTWSTFQYQPECWVKWLLNFCSAQRSWSTAKTTAPSGFPRRTTGVRR